LKHLFAPWRMAVLEAYDTSSGCILCHLKDSKDDAESLIIHRSNTSYVVLNKFPYANGHLMIVPFRHVSHWGELDEAEVLDIHRLTTKALDILKREMRAEAFNLGVNLGSAAGAGIPDHVHQHIVPRWTGDVNFMPLFAEVKVISEHLEATYQKIKKAWDL
jgi:ATP adenylyltransferase